MGDWWQAQLGVDAGATREERHAAFERAFPGLLTYRPEAAPEPVPDPNHGYTMLLAMGAALKRDDRGGFDVEKMSVEQMVELRPPDYENNPIVRRLREAIRETRRRHGSAYDGSYSGLLYPALKLRGQEIFTDFYDHPDVVHRFTAVMEETIRRHLLFLKQECGSLPYFILGNCSNCMISPSIYERFLVAGESRLSLLSKAIMGRRRAMGVHHCGTRVDAYVEAYAKIAELEMLEASWDSDIAGAERWIPGLKFKSMLDPIRLDELDEDELQTHLRQQFGPSPTIEIQAFGLSHRFTRDKMRRMLEVAGECRREQGLAGYNRLIV